MSAFDAGYAQAVADHAAGLAALLDGTRPDEYRYGYELGYAHANNQELTA